MRHLSTNNLKQVWIYSTIDIVKRKLQRKLKLLDSEKNKGMIKKMLIVVDLSGRERFRITKKIIH